MNYLKSLVALLLLTGVAFCNQVDYQGDDGEVANIYRSETLPEEPIDDLPDHYFEGYLQALVDMHYHEYRVVVYYDEGIAYLANLPKNKLTSNSIISFVQDVPGVESVQIYEDSDKQIVRERDHSNVRPQVSGIWFPQSTELFQPLIASPRAILYSANYRRGGDVIGKDVIAISLGDDFPIYRWLEVLPWNGDLQFGIQACIWSVFKMGVHVPGTNEISELVNTDYYLGIPITYAVNNWSFRFRIYHISCHLGDERLVNGTPIARVNPSFEAIDFFASYQANSHLRLYVGPGFIMHSDGSFPMDRLYVQYGGEFRFWGTRMLKQKLYGTWLLGAHLQNWQYQNWGYDGNYIFGYEWSKLQGTGRKMRILLNGHNGYSQEGQFSKRKDAYAGVVLAWGF
ncbi:MAG TPA: DUF1207 domain-containing protein [Chlamydiales bacterium]|nr:DUF1207 domain-containing protein [Chlamydiales bacterium]